MNSQDSLDALDSLFAKMLDEPLDSSEQAFVVERLKFDAAARARYLRFIDLHCLLHWKSYPWCKDNGDSTWTATERNDLLRGLSRRQGALSGAEGLMQGLDIDGSQVVSPERAASALHGDGNGAASSPDYKRNVEQAEEKEVQLASRFTLLRSRPIASSLLCAAVVVLVGLAVMAMWRIPEIARRHSETDSEREGANSEPANMRSPARVACTAEANDAEGNDYALDQPVPRGKWHHLAAGQLELETVQGARLAVSAPASFMMLDASTMRVDCGRVSAMVPPTANGLTIVTPSARVVDRGTEFGIKVDGNRDTEVHVFGGRVEVSSFVLLDEGRQRVKRTVELLVDMAVRVNADKSGIEAIEIDREAFVPSGNKPHSNEALEQIAIKRYWYSGEIQSSSARLEISDDKCNKLISSNAIDPQFTSGQWVGFSDPMRIGADSKDPQPQIDFELETSTGTSTVDSIEVVYFVYHPGAIHAPGELRIYGDDDEQFENPQLLAKTRKFNDDDLTGQNDPDWRSIRHVRIRLERSDKRFFRLEFFCEHKWTFLGRVRFFAAPDGQVRHSKSGSTGA